MTFEDERCTHKWLYLRSAPMVFIDTALASVRLQLEKCLRLQEVADTHIRDEYSSSDSENMEYIIHDTVLPSIKSDKKFSDPCQRKIKLHSSMTICCEYMCFRGKPRIKQYPHKTETLALPLILCMGWEGWRLSWEIQGE